MKRRIWLQALLGILLSSVLFGQLFRLDLLSNTAGGLLISDVLVLGTALVLAGLILAGRVRLPGERGIGRWLLVWIAALLVSYVVGMHGHSRSQLLVGFGYLVRLVAYYGILVASYHMFASLRGAVYRYLLYLTLGLLAIGGLIMVILPDFAVLAAQGWDPHVGRLTSTWLDPNYFGCFLALVFALFLPLAGEAKKRGKWWYAGYCAFLLIVYVGIYLTYSRSALVTLFFAAGIVAARMSWRTLVLVLLLIASSFILPSRLQGRITQTVTFAVQGGKSASADATSSADPTASARFESWKRAIKVYGQNPVTGVGYNFYQYEQQSLGVIASGDVEKNRSSAGSDSSLLTLLATTGIVGIAAFAGLWLAIVRRLWQFRRDPYVLGVLGALLGWLVSSFLNNTLLYAPIMLPMFLVLGATLGALGRAKN